MIAEPWLDKSGIAEHFRCSTKEIERAVYRGMPHAVIFGRKKFRASEVEAWLFAHAEIDLRGERVTLPVPDERSEVAA